MYKLVLNKKTGFKNPSNNDIFIYDYRGVLFYSTELLDKKDVEFNLPEGSYTTPNNIIQLPEPYKNRKIRLPKPEREIDIKGTFKIVFAPNKNKATVYYNNPRIVFDTSFKDKPLPELWFAYYHEIGHLYYSTEKYADLYAVKKMLQKGYNVSQIGKATMLLSEKSNYRKQNVVNNLTQNNLNMKRKNKGRILKAILSGGTSEVVNKIKNKKAILAGILTGGASTLAMKVIAKRKLNKLKKLEQERALRHLKNRAILLQAAQKKYN